MMNKPKRQISKLSTVVIERISKFLEEKDITQYELANLSGLPYPTIKSIMQGRTDSINLKTIILLAHGFGMKPSEFIDDDKFLAENLGLL